MRWGRSAAYNRILHPEHKISLTTTTISISFRGHGDYLIGQRSRDHLLSTHSSYLKRTLEGTISLTHPALHRRLAYDLHPHYKLNLSLYITSFIAMDALRAGP